MLLMRKRIVRPENGHHYSDTLLAVVEGRTLTSEALHAVQAWHSAAVGLL